MKSSYTLEYYVQRIAHFLKGVRTRKNLTQTEIAKSLKLSVSTISRLESQKLDSMTLDNLLCMSSLAEMRLSNFFLYLEKNSNSSNNNELAPWQKDAIEGLAKLKTRTRLLFLKKFLMESSIEKQELLIGLLVELAELQKTSLVKLTDLISDLKGK